MGKEERARRKAKKLAKLVKLVRESSYGFTPGSARGISFEEAKMLVNEIESLSAGFCPHLLYDEYGHETCEAREQLAQFRATLHQGMTGHERGKCGR